MTLISPISPRFGAVRLGRVGSTDSRTDKSDLEGNHADLIRRLEEKGLDIVLNSGYNGGDNVGYSVDLVDRASGDTKFRKGYQLDLVELLERQAELQ